MRIYTVSEVARWLPYDVLVAGLREAFRADSTVPLRTTHAIELPSGGRATLYLMPAWKAGSALVVKLATAFPGNSAVGLPTLNAQVLLFDGQTGVPSAIVDGTELTRRRTAAASALAATYCAREHATRLLVVGTGAQAPHQALAHAAVRPIREIEIWGRSPERARATAEALSRAGGGFTVRAVDDLEAAVGKADVISCVTGATTPVIRGEWLSRGVFVDLVGAHTPDTRECDDEAARRARIYVDTLVGAMQEAGDILIPLRRGVIDQAHVIGDLYGLCRGEIQGRQNEEEITLFKSVGTGLEDLAAAQLVVARGERGH